MMCSLVRFEKLKSRLYWSIINRVLSQNENIELCIATNQQAIQVQELALTCCAEISTNLSKIRVLPWQKYPEKLIKECHCYLDTFPMG